MSTLNDLKQQATEIANNLQASVAAAAHCAKQADDLAEQLTSAGVPAVAHGWIDGLHLIIWVTAGPVTADRLSEILTRLDLVELDRSPGQHECEFRLQGITPSLYALHPKPQLTLS